MSSSRDTDESRDRPSSSIPDYLSGTDDRDHGPHDEAAATGEVGSNDSASAELHDVPLYDSDDSVGPASPPRPKLFPGVPRTVPGQPKPRLQATSHDQSTSYLTSTTQHIFGAAQGLTNLALSQTQSFLGRRLRRVHTMEAGGSNHGYGEEEWPQAGNADAQDLAGIGEHGKLECTVSKPLKEGEGTQNPYISYLVTVEVCTQA